MNPADIAATLTKTYLGYMEMNFGQQVDAAYSRHLGRAVTLEEVLQGASKEKLHDGYIFYWHDEPVLRTHTVTPPIDLESIFWQPPYTVYTYMGNGSGK